MRTWRVGFAAFAAVLLGGAGCIDFEQEGTLFCQHHPERCPGGAGTGQNPPTGGDGPTGEGEAGAPELIEFYQSAPSALSEGSITLRITVRDAGNGPLEFSWTPHAGRVETPVHTANTSEIVWRAPTCMPHGRVSEVTASVTNALRRSASKRFVVTTTPCVTLSAGNAYSMSLRSDGTPWAWGNNEFGQLGTGTNTHSATPLQVSGLSELMVISAGNNAQHAIALGTDGSVWSWGANWYGQLGDGTTAHRAAPVQVSGPSTVVAVSAGGNFSLAMRRDGLVWAWGYNAEGELGDGTATHRSTPMPVSDVSDAVMASAGDQHALAMSSDGTVWAWGHNTSGQVGDGTLTHRTTPSKVSGLSGVVAVSAGGQHSLALRGDGTVWAWGYNESGALGDGSTLQRSTPVQVSGLSGVVAISAGYLHSLALRHDGTVWAWGSNTLNQLGDGTAEPQRSTPVRVSGLSDVVAISAGRNHSLAMHADGTLWAWGRNATGQLGDGTTTQRATPVPVSP
ncbi:MAG TPA: RCC1 repeat-containing protein [Archangium sp.]|uniref:RCC1 domain-containing protein n=1 Tax=Archangium sp. TaxID=1872627 RepID=UPI002E3316ED|nr:RCC1 repeat-containing protein [Archangium sp.]HEX5752852.1 RCC1 repeat-containing protein [Archangium sp.]